MTRQVVYKGPAYAGLLVNGVEQPGARQECVMAIISDGCRVFIDVDREMTLTSQDGGEATVGFFRKPVGDDYLVMQASLQDAIAGGLLRMTPKPKQIEGKVMP